MSDLVFPHDHEEIAWSHFLAQHLGKSYTEGFVRAFYPPINTLDKALSDLYTLRWLETAEGEQLDGIGSIVGLNREVPNSVYYPFFGFITQPSGRAFNTYRIRHDNEPYETSSFLDDYDYRIAINAKIALNNGHGTAEDIMAYCDYRLKVTKTAIFDIGNANANMYINDLLLVQTDYRAAIVDQIIPRAGGVKIFPYVFDATKVFGFANYPAYFGFGVGILARSILGNTPAIGIVNSPDLSINFLIDGSLDSRIAFTRASTGTYIDVAGVMQTAAINTPRWDYDPVTHVLRGLLMEEARTNVLLNSTTLSTQSVTVTAQAYTLSFYGTGTITKSGTATGALVGTGVGQRVTQTFTPTAGSLTLTVTGTVTNAQLEAGTFATSYISTAGTAITRAKDQALLDKTGWNYPLGGSWFAEYIRLNTSPTAGYTRVVQDHLATGNTQLFAAANGQGGIYDGGTVLTTVNTHPAATVAKQASAWTLNQGKVCLDGGAVAKTSMTSGYNAQANPMAIMQIANVAESITGYMRQLKYWRNVLSDAEMQAVTL